MSTTGLQFGRTASLIVTGKGGGAGLDLSDLSSSSEGLRFRFEILASDIQTPNIATIRIYNLSEETTREVISEYSTVILNAGYKFNSSLIFKGDVKQYRRGKERNTDSFLDIYAADGDQAYNFSTVNASLSNATPQTVVQTLADSMGLPLDVNALGYLTEQNFPFPRGKVMFGLARDYFRDIADTNNLRWSIQNGVITLIPITGYLPGQAVQINSQTGMIGSPEATEQGVTVQCLLNPLIRIGTAIQLNSKDITATTIKEQNFPGYTDLTYVAKVESTAPDGYYRAVVVEHRGDTRDQEWYTKVTCLLIDKSSPANNSVAPYCIPQ